MSFCSLPLGSGTRRATGFAAGHDSQRSTGTALLVIAEDLQFHGQIHLAQGDAFRDRQHDRREVEDDVMPAATRRSTALWAAEGGVATTPIETLRACTICGRSSR
jgi:hypothetical protein